MNPQEVALDAAELNQVYPYYFALDPACRIVGTGSKLEKVCPGMKAGLTAGSLFEVQRPRMTFTAGSIRRQLSQLILLRCTGSGVSLRGQFLEMKRKHLFLFIGSPWFTDVKAVQNAGLGFGDFAVHDPVMEQLLVLQLQNLSVEELKQLSEKLLSQKRDLAAANAALEQKNRSLLAAEALMRADQEKIRLLSMVASRTDNSVLITDSNGCIQWVNEAFTRTTGYTLQEVAGKRPHSILHGPETDPEAADYVRNCIREQRPFRLEVINYNKTGLKYWTQIDAQPLFNDAGVLQNYLEVQNDITNQKLYVELLRNEKELLSATLHSMHDGVVVLDESGRIKMLNPAASLFFGWSHHDANMERIQDVVGTSTEAGSKLARLLDECHERAQQNASPFSVMDGFSLRSAKGETRAIRASVAPLTGPKGLPGGAIIFLRDVTREKESERVKEDFIHSVSHELHTPIAAIQGFVSTLLKEPEMPAGLRLEFLNIVDQQSSRLKQLVDNILQVSKVESGIAAQDDLQADLYSVVLSSVQEVQSLLQARSIVLKSDLSRPGLWFYGDPVVLQSISTNLLTNAIKFSPEQSTVELELRRDGGQFIIQVRDHGVGIAPEKIQMIFQKFARISNQTNRASGTGLGLFIVNNIVARYKGRIEVESSLGRGSCFRVYLPDNLQSFTRETRSETVQPATMGEKDAINGLPS